MHKKNTGGGGINIQGNAKERENAELTAMLDIDRDALGPGKLNVIDPSKWKNQPVSLT